MFGLFSAKFSEEEIMFFSRLGFSVNNFEAEKIAEVQAAQAFNPNHVIKAKILKQKKGYKITCFVQEKYWDDPSAGRGGGNFETRAKRQGSVVLEKLDSVQELLKIKKIID